MSGNIVLGFLIVFFLFVPIERIFSLKKSQKIFRKGWFNDLFHFFFNNLLVKAGLVIVLIPLAIILKPWINPNFQASIAALPHYLQFIIALLVAEIFHYWAHRLMHEVPKLWHFHAVHHSIEEMDWLASARLHPVDQVISKAITIMPLYLMGFSKATFGAFLVFSLFYALFIHSNVKVSMGFLRYIIATPEFHHWHHAADKEAHDKNFAGFFPFLDMIFGTFHLPKGRLPEKYGVEEAIPHNYLKQMVYPFQK